jgi:hypothetical protein
LTADLNRPMTAAIRTTNSFYTQNTNQNASVSMYNQPQLGNNNYTPLSRYATQVDMSDIDILKEMNDDDQSNYIHKMFTFLKSKLQGLNTNDAEFPN